MSLPFLCGADAIEAVLFERYQSAEVAAPHWNFHVVGRHPVTMPPHATGPDVRLMGMWKSDFVRFRNGMPKFRKLTAQSFDSPT